MKINLAKYNQVNALEVNRETPGQMLPTPVLFFPFLLFQFKLPLLLCLSLFSAHSPAFSFQLFLL